MHFKHIKQASSRDRQTITRTPVYTTSRWSYSRSYSYTTSPNSFRPPVMLIFWHCILLLESIIKSLFNKYINISENRWGKEGGERHWTKERQALAFPLCANVQLPWNRPTSPSPALPMPCHPFPVSVVTTEPPRRNHSYGEKQRLLQPFHSPTSPSLLNY